MSYSAFVLVALLPPIVLLALAGLTGRSSDCLPRARFAVRLAVIFTLVVIAPLVVALSFLGVWTFGGTTATEGGWMTIAGQSLLFYTLCALLGGAMIKFVVQRWELSTIRPAPGVRIFGSLIYAAFGVAGLLFLMSGNARALHLGVVLAWLAPSLVAMWGYGGDHLREFMKPASAAIAASTLIAWAVNAGAFWLGLRGLSPATSFGLAPFGLAFEDAILILSTNILVAQGFLLMVFESRLAQRRVLVRNVSLT
jgi:hypothetical protein